MKLSTIKSEGLSREFKVTVPATDIKPVYEIKLAAYAKNFSMPGFRKGKVPLSQVKARYGYKAFKDAVDALIHTTQHQVFEQEKITPLSAPKISVSKMENETTDLEYTMLFDIMPEFPELDFSGFKADKITAEISDEDFQSVMEERFKEFKMYGPSKKKAAALGGAVKGDVTFHVDGKAENTSNNIRIELLESNENDKIISNLVGAKTGETRKIQLDPIQEKGKEKVVEFEILINEILDRIPVQLNDEFAKELGFNDFNDFKDDAIKHLHDEAEEKSRACLKRTLLDFIDLQANFDVPLSMVNAELQTILRQVKSELTETEKKETNDEKLKEEYKDIANRRVRLGLLLSHIGNKRKIKISNEELSQEVYRLAQVSGTDVKKLVEYLNQHPDALNSIQAPVFEEKVVNALLSEMNLAEKKISLKKLNEYYNEVLSADMPTKDQQADTATEKKKAASKSKTTESSDATNAENVKPKASKKKASEK